MCVCMQRDQSCAALWGVKNLEVKFFVEICHNNMRRLSTGQAITR